MMSKESLKETVYLGFLIIVCIFGGYVIGHITGKEYDSSKIDYITLSDIKRELTDQITDHEIKMILEKASTGRYRSYSEFYMLGDEGLHPSMRFEFDLSVEECPVCKRLVDFDSEVLNYTVVFTLQYSYIQRQWELKKNSIEYINQEFIYDMDSINED